MNLAQPSQENADFLLKEITSKLKMVNTGVFENLTIEQIDYEVLFDLYKFISRKPALNPREMQLFAEELRHIRKKKTD